MIVPAPLRLRFVLAAVALAGILWFPAVGVDWFSDDWLHVGVLDGTVPALPEPYDLFVFASDPASTRFHIEHGPLPWWTDPDVHLAFWRPLSSALAMADHALFGTAPAGAHVHSLLWYLALVAAVGLLLRRLLPARVAGVALFLFAVALSHGLPAAWPANRNALVAAVPGVLGILAHVRWREDGWRPGLPLSMMLFAIAFLGGESALCALAFVAAYEAVGAQGSISRRALALTPAVMVLVAWAATYRALGYGVEGSGTYLDPLASPVAFAAAAAVRVPTLILGQVTGFPPEAAQFVDVPVWVVVAGGLASAALLLVLARPAAAALPAPAPRHLRWLLLGAGLGLVPVAGTFPALRLLLVPGLGALAAIAAILVHAWDTRGRFRPYLPGAGALALIHAVAAPLLVPPLLLGWGAFVDAHNEVFASAELDDSIVESQSVVVLRAPDVITGLYTPIQRAVDGRPMPRAWWLVSAAPCSHLVTRTGPRVLQLVPDGCALLRGDLELLVRSSDRPLAAGDEVRLDGMTVTVVEETGGAPTRIALRFDDDPGDPRYTFLAWRDGGLRKVEPPAEGGVLVLRRPEGIPF